MVRRGQIPGIGSSCSLNGNGALSGPPGPASEHVYPLTGPRAREARGSCGRGWGGEDAGTGISLHRILLDRLLSYHLTNSYTARMPFFSCTVLLLHPSVILIGLLIQRRRLFALLRSIPLGKISRSNGHGATKYIRAANNRQRRGVMVARSHSTLAGQSSQTKNEIRASVGGSLSPSSLAIKRGCILAAVCLV